jgi:hypothetical protein
MDEVRVQVENIEEDDETNEANYTHFRIVSIRFKIDEKTMKQKIKIKNNLEKIQNAMEQIRQYTKKVFDELELISREYVETYRIRGKKKDDFYTLSLR